MAKTARTTRARSSKKIAAPLLLTYRPAGVTITTEPNAHVAAFAHETGTMEMLTARALTTAAYEERLAQLTETFAQVDDLDAALDALTLDLTEATEAEILSAEADAIEADAGQWESDDANPAFNPPSESDAPVSFREKMLSFSEDQVSGMTQRVAAAISAREAFELEKKGAGHNIQKTLAKVRKQLMWKDTSRVLLAAQVDPAFINRVLHDGSCYNVYAIDKVADAIKGLAEGTVSNAINRACMVSLFQMRKAGLAFTGEIAKGCASDKHHVDLAIRKHLLRHTVSASTAPTQASSTMQALETLGIVKREGSTRNPTFTLTGSPIVDRLEEVLFAKAA